ncbi:MAG: hypothetical protein J6J53_04115, partial [Muribaculaceae bacterium]|nr:hypothetical protein [Muribaculaceae bacterium]
MNGFLKTIEKNKALVNIVLAALMLVFFALCPAVDIAGKAQANGFELIFKAKGLGFQRVLGALMIIAPALIIAARFIDFKFDGALKEHFNGICFAASLIMCLLMAVSLPSGISLAWGSWLY